MLFKKGSRGDGSLLQNQFTAYLVTSLRRRKKDIIQARIRHDQREVYVGLEEVFYALRSTDAPLDELVCDEPTSFDDMYFENVATIIVQRVKVIVAIGHSKREYILNIPPVNIPCAR